MYDVKPNLVIGFHGCERSIRDQLLNKPNEIIYSRQPYDWLGHGMYFWENNYTRAFQWAEDKMRRGAIQNPAVIGGVLYLDYCCDFLDAKYIQMLKVHHKAMADFHKAGGKEMPQNKDLPQDKHKDKILRELDCASLSICIRKIQCKPKRKSKRKVSQKVRSSIPPAESSRKVARLSKGPGYLRRAISRSAYAIRIVY
jgi:hypothetical protein